MSTSPEVIEVAFEDGGPSDAPALLLAGSLGTSMAMWDPQVDPLRERLRAIRYDHRGQGASPVPRGPYDIADLGRDALALMDRLGLERASFCGLSIGGMVGLWLGVHAPERLDRLVVCCTSAHVPPPERWLERADAVLAAGSTEVVADPVVDRWLTPACAAAHPSVRAELRAMLIASPPEGYAACCGVLARLDLREDLSSIAVPTLVIGGAQDEAIPPDHQERLAAAIPGARLELLSPAAHIASAEQPDRFTRLILDHLDVPEAP